MNYFCFLESESRKLSHEYDNRTYTINRNLVDKGAICPDYDVDVPYYNTLFSGDNFVISKLRDINLKREEWNHRFYYEEIFCKFIQFLFEKKSI